MLSRVANSIYWMNRYSPARDAVLQFMSFDRINSNFSALYHKKCRKFEIEKKSPHLRSINQII